MDWMLIGAEISLPFLSAEETSRTLNFSSGTLGGLNADLLHGLLDPTSGSVFTLFESGDVPYPFFLLAVVCGRY